MHLSWLLGLIWEWGYTKYLPASRLEAEHQALQAENDLLREMLVKLAPESGLRWEAEQKRQIMVLALFWQNRIDRSAAQWVANRFVVSLSTAYRWIRIHNAGKGFVLPWNKLDDEVRRKIHLLKEMCCDMGLRTMEGVFRMGGVLISESTIHNILKESPPKHWPEKRVYLPPACDIEPYGPLRPEKPNQVWQVDFTSRG